MNRLRQLPLLCISRAIHGYGAESASLQSAICILFPILVAVFGRSSVGRSWIWSNHNAVLYQSKRGGFSRRW